MFMTGIPEWRYRPRPVSWNECLVRVHLTALDAVALTQELGLPTDDPYNLARVIWAMRQGHTP